MRVRKGLANAAIIGQRGNGFRSLFKTRTSRILKILGIIFEKSIDKAPTSWNGQWVFGRSVPQEPLTEELGLNSEIPRCDLKD